MVYVLGLGCIAWTLIELMRLSQPTPAPVRSPASQQVHRSASASQRAPLAAWDDQGRPIFVEDVSIRGAR